MSGAVKAVGGLFGQAEKPDTSALDKDLRARNRKLKNDLQANARRSAGGMSEWLAAGSLGGGNSLMNSDKLGV